MNLIGVNLLFEKGKPHRCFFRRPLYLSYKTIINNPNETLDFI